jgi:hypothetical protein
MSAPLQRPGPVSLALLAGFAAALFAFPIVAGWSALHALGWSAFVLAFVLLPGCAVRAWIDRERDAASALFLALTYGLACLSFTFLALAAVDQRQLVWGLPAAGAIAWFAARRRGAGGSRQPPSIAELIAILAALVAALTRVVVEDPSSWYVGFETDAAFHVENAIELARQWPMADPRIAGEPLRYHFLSYTPAAAASVVLGLPVRECLQGLGAHLLPLVFALGLFGGARALGAKPPAALLVALALVLHADLGAFIGRVFGFEGSFGSYFDAGLYLSTTTAQGLCTLLALMIVTADLFAARLRSGPALAAVALLAALASGSKGSVLPPLVFALIAAWCLKKEQRPVIARTIAVLACAALPFTLWLVMAPEGYAQSMFSWSPGAAQALSPFQWKVIAFFGGNPRAPHALATAATFVPWCIGFLGIGVIALWAWFATRARPASTIEIVILVTAIAGMVPAVLFAAPGLSQLFFAYDTQVCAVLLGAIASTRIAPRKGRVLGVVVSAVILIQAAAGWTAPGPSTIRVTFEGDVARYRAVLDWIRAEAPADAVFLVDEPRLCASTWTERRAYFETQRYSSRVHAGFAVVGGTTNISDARLFADEERMQSSFFAGPFPGDFPALRARTGRGVPLYALRSKVTIEWRPMGYVCTLHPLADAAEFGRAAGLALVHDGGNAAVYRLPD